MMAFVEKTAKTVEEAVAAALKELNITAEEAVIEVLEEGKKGLFGFFGKDAKVRVTAKEVVVEETVVETVVEEAALVVETVVETEAKTNTVYVGYNDELYSKNLILKNVEWSYPIDKTEVEVMVKIRYNMDFVKALVKKFDSYCTVEFEQPVSAITLGQACVFYDINDGHLLGGGFI